MPSCCRKWMVPSLHTSQSTTRTSHAIEANGSAQVHIHPAHHPHSCPTHRRHLIIPYIHHNSASSTTTHHRHLVLPLLSTINNGPGQPPTQLNPSPPSLTHQTSTFTPLEPGTRISWRGTLWIIASATELGSAVFYVLQSLDPACTPGEVNMTSDDMDDEARAGELAIAL